MTEPLPPIAELLPQSGPMCLLHRLLGVDAERLQAEVDIGPDGLFHRDEGVGGWVALEYMAQAVAAWAGWQARQAGRGPSIGFLLGSRRFRSVDRFLPGQCLRVEVERLYQADNGLGQFDCRVLEGGLTLAQAQITVFGPDDPDRFLKGDMS